MKRLFELVTRVEEFILSFSVLGMAALTIANVIARSLLGFSLAFAEELSQFLIILVVFVGLSYGAGKGRHIRMTALYDQLRPELRKTLMLVMTGTTAALMFYLTACSLRYVQTVEVLGTLSPALGVPLSLVYLAAPLGLALAGVQYFLAFVANLRRDGIYLSFTQPEGPSS